MSAELDLFKVLDGLSTTAEEKVAHSLENLSIAELETILKNEGMNKEAKELTSKARNKLPGGDFVFPEDRRYPIHDEAHARNALARASGKPEEAKVRAAVHAKFPNIGSEGKEKKSSADVSLEQKVAEADRMGRELARKDFEKYAHRGVPMEKVALGLKEVGGMASKAVSALKSNPAAKSALRNVAVGAAGGAAAGAIRKPTNGQSRLGNALKGGAIGGTGAAVGTAAFHHAPTRRIIETGVDRAKNTVMAGAMSLGRRMAK